MRAPQCILFDLDGTLLDTAPTFINIAKKMLGVNALPLDRTTELKYLVSKGARRFLAHAFNCSMTDERRLDDLQAVFLKEYQSMLFEATLPIEGIEALLSEIEDLNVPWGIVSNKPELFCFPLIKHFNWAHRASIVIGGDTTPERKPSPLPLITACQSLRIAPEECLFVGDARIDVQAGNAANIPTLIADFGYIPPSESPTTWGGVGIVTHPQQIITQFTDCYV